MACLCNLVGIFVFGMHFVVICKVDIAVGCVLAYNTCKTDLVYMPMSHNYYLVFMCNAAAIFSQCYVTLWC